MSTSKHDAIVFDRNSRREQVFERQLQLQVCDSQLHANIAADTRPQLLKCCWKLQLRQLEFFRHNVMSLLAFVTSSHDDASLSHSLQVDDAGDVTLSASSDDVIVKS